MSLTYGFDLGVAGATYTAEQFAEMFEYVGGNAITEYGSKFKLTLGSGLSFTIGSGYLYVNGYWLKNTAAISYTLSPAYSSASRYDAVAVVIDFENRVVTLDLLKDIDPASPVRDDSIYQVYLYIIAVARNLTLLSESAISDQRVFMTSLGDITEDVRAVYEYTTETMESEISDLANVASNGIESANTAYSEAATAAAGQFGYVIGDLKESAATPSPSNEWLECNGASINSAYANLITVLNSSTLPNISADDDRLTEYIYAGTPNI